MSRSQGSPPEPSGSRLAGFGFDVIPLALSAVEGNPAASSADGGEGSAFSFGRLSFFTFALLFISFAPSVRAQGRAECRVAPSKILGHPVPYCVILSPSYDSQPPQHYPVLYFLHGLGGSSQSFVDSGGFNAVEDLWQQKQVKEFLIVTPDAGRSFYVNSRDGRVRYEDFFIREFIPYIESHYRIRSDRRDRGISGVSMGGYGALRLAFHYPDLFGSVSAHSAALIEKSPLAGMSGAQEMGISRFLGSAFGVPFDPAYWQRENPFTIVRNSPRPVGLQIYFDCGTDDNYGFNAGAQAFHDLLVARKIPHEFHLYPGAHDWAYFAAHLPASLEFHSRAFDSVR
jgi:S-formylglutathione hydrolase FrmB